MNDRRVHARSETLEVVRYDRAGKWYLECARDAPPKERTQVTIREAVDAARKIQRLGGVVCPGLRGGSRFDSLLREDVATNA